MRAAPEAPGTVKCGRGREGDPLWAHDVVEYGRCAVAESQQQEVRMRCSHRHNTERTESLNG
jgi:hypothetical protein